MNETILILGMMLVTFAARYPVLALVGRAPLPPLAVRALRFVPPVVLTAITVPAMLLPKQHPGIDLQNAYLWAGILSILIAWRTRNLLLTIALGMGIFLLWRAIAGV